MARNKKKQTNLLIITSTNNALKCSSGKSEGFAHKLMKFLICNYCWENNLDFSTEVVFKNNSRCDVVINEWGVGFEVLNTETKEKYLNKKYPIPTVPVSVNMTAQQINDMLKDLSQTEGKEYQYYINKNLQIHNSTPL